MEMTDFMRVWFGEIGTNGDNWHIRSNEQNISGPIFEAIGHHTENVLIEAFKILVDQFNRKKDGNISFPTKKEFQIACEEAIQIINIRTYDVNGRCPCCENGWIIANKEQTKEKITKFAERFGIDSEIFEKWERKLKGYPALYCSNHPKKILGGKEVNNRYFEDIFCEHKARDRNLDCSECIVTNDYACPKCVTRSDCNPSKSNPCPKGWDYYQDAKKMKLSLEIEGNKFYQKGLEMISNEKVRAILESTGFENRDRKDDGAFSDIAKAREVFEI